MITGVTGQRIDLGEARLLGARGMMFDVDLEKAAAKADRTAAAGGTADPLQSLSSPYATVQVDGQVVASVDNQGIVMLSSELAASLADDMPALGGDQRGPAMAQARADYIAEALSGEVVASPSALSQEDFDLAFSKGRIEWVTARSDGETALAAHEAGQEENEPEVQAREGVDGLESDWLSDFLAYMQLSPEERLAASPRDWSPIADDGEQAGEAA